MKRMKYLFCIGLGFLLLLNSSGMSVSAMTEEAGVSFYADDEEEPEEESGGKKKGTGSSTEKAGLKTKKRGTSYAGSKLPQTGEHTKNPYSAAGILLLAAGLVALGMRRRKLHAQVRGAEHGKRT